jgi:hypothetical protein
MRELELQGVPNVEMSRQVIAENSKRMTIK